MAVLDSLGQALPGTFAGQQAQRWPLQVDSKREVEKLVKAACEAFIMALTKAAVEAMLSFITKVTAVRVARPASGTAKPLREQVWLDVCLSRAQGWVALSMVLWRGDCCCCQGALVHGWRMPVVMTQCACVWARMSF